MSSSATTDWQIWPPVMPNSERSSITKLEKNVMEGNSVRYERCLRSGFGLSRLSASPAAVAWPLRKPPAQAGGSSGQSPGSRPGLLRNFSIPDWKQCAVSNTIAMKGFFQIQLAPPQDAAAVPLEKPWLFLGAPFWKKAMEGFFQIQLVLFVESGIELPIARSKVEVVNKFAGLGGTMLAIHSAIFPFDR